MLLKKQLSDGTTLLVAAAVDTGLCCPGRLNTFLKASVSGRRHLLLVLTASGCVPLQCGVNALEGYIRPGCVHLTLHAMVASEAGAQLEGLGVRALVQHLVSASDHALWSSNTLLVQRISLSCSCPP